MKNYDYDLEFTDTKIPSIFVGERKKFNTIIDITLFGFKKLDFGRELHENLVHVLENFAVPEDASNVGNPDLLVANYNLLDNQKPVEGQIWYNKTDSVPFIRHTDRWNPLANAGQDEVAANWGQILNGEQLPQPVSQNGYVFPYEECRWTVSPFNQLDELTEMICRTDEDANVIIEYLYDGDMSSTGGVANYMIVGFKDNSNSGIFVTPGLQPSQTPTPTPSSSTGSIPTITPTPTPTPTVSPPQSYPSLQLSMLDPYTTSCLGNPTCEARYNISSSDYELTGGSGNRTYSWGYVSGSQFSFSSASTAFPELIRLSNIGEVSTGTGILTVTDNITGEVVNDTFQFTSTHSSIVASPTPTPTSTSTPVVSNSPSPTPSITPTPTPTATITPSPSESGYTELTSTTESLNDDSFACPDNGQSYISIGPFVANLTVSGGSGNYSIVQSFCDDNDIDDKGVGGISIDACANTTVTISATGADVIFNASLEFDEDDCEFKTATTYELRVGFDITDNVTGNVVNDTVVINWTVNYQ